MSLLNDKSGSNAIDNDSCHYANMHYATLSSSSQWHHARFVLVVLRNRKSRVESRRQKKLTTRHLMTDARKIMYSCVTDARADNI